MPGELIIHFGLEAICPASLTSTFACSCPAAPTPPAAGGMRTHPPLGEMPPDESDVRSVPTPERLSWAAPAYFQVEPLAASLSLSLVAIILWK